MWWRHEVPQLRTGMDGDVSFICPPEFSTPLTLTEVSHREMNTLRTNLRRARQGVRMLIELLDKGDYYNDAIIDAARKTLEDEACAT